ncbi:MAG: hypothetical protein KAS63_07315 [Candidatus Heimdallarchaeota archaeon]|nr:hypothetical protein [Candidatus Heimdallarchaeota archaeon]MCK4955156.1 hypothetical protein [Candidatus Heimdallarchaeota archaeon]
MKKGIMNNTRPLICKIVDKWEECDDTFGFVLELPIKIQKAKPGQFIMLWIPGVDEYPVGIAGIKNGFIEIGVAKMGVGTSAMIDKQKGDFVGIRGFFGKPFKPPKNVNHLLIGGGFGMTPLKLLTSSLINFEEMQRVHIFEGARSKNKLMYLEWLENLENQEEIFFHVSTDDGSYGYKGFPTVDLEKFLQNNKTPSVIYAAGPERMMKVIFDLGKKYSNVIDMQMSLADRYIRCGFGLCAGCVVDPTGWRICTDGPIFNTEQLEQITDFGNFRRTETGAKEKI